MMTKKEKKQMKTALALDGAASSVNDIGARLKKLGTELESIKPPRLLEDVQAFLEVELARLEDLTRYLAESKEILVDLTKEYYEERK